MEWVAIWMRGTWERVKNLWGWWHLLDVVDGALLAVDRDIGGEPQASGGVIKAVVPGRAIAAVPHIPSAHHHDGRESDGKAVLTGRRLGGRGETDPEKSSGFSGATAWVRHYPARGLGGDKPCGQIAAHVQSVGRV